VGCDVRPRIELCRDETRVLVEHTTVVQPASLGDSAGWLDAAELRAVGDALAAMSGL
jgi:hypothetical protein